MTMKKKFKNYFRVCFHNLISICVYLFFGWVLLDIVAHLPDNHYGGFGLNYYIVLVVLFVLSMVDCIILKKINWLRLLNFVLFLVLFLISNPCNVNVTYGTWISRGMPQWGVYVPQNEWHVDWKEILKEENDYE